MRATFPSFLRRGGCAIQKMAPFLQGAAGVVSNFKKYGALRGPLKTTYYGFALSGSRFAPVREATLLENGGECRSCRRLPCLFDNTAIDQGSEVIAGSGGSLLCRSYPWLYFAQ